MAPPAEIRRRRLWALAALAGVAAVLGAVAGGGGDSEEPEPGASTLPPECAQQGPDGLRRAAGQMVMVKLEASASRDLQRAAETGAIGGVIVFPPPEAGTGAVRDAIERLQDAAAQGSQP